MRVLSDRDAERSCKPKIGQLHGIAYAVDEQVLRLHVTMEDTAGTQTFAQMDWIAEVACGMANSLAQSKPPTDANGSKQCLATSGTKSAALSKANK